MFPNCPRDRNTCAERECRYSLLPEAKRGHLPVVNCALEVADEGEHTYDQIGAILHLSRETVRLIAEEALRKIRNGRHLEDYVDSELGRETLPAVVRMGRS
ncbi:MAG: hypothetical protein IPH07_23545 [Deltaproteobacteria bacterium]|nr:hypothetical protein [Deltaproteobacteria bacterium]MBK8241764.1 hypothetical protein [Deltaproteobacteria bacterium]MBK8720623.1 hypothetical protein [Deltaproteobacteria bacterium]